MKIGLLFLISLLLFNINFAAETDLIPPKGKCVIKGVIIDKTIEKPVEYSNIVLYNALDSSLITGTISDVNGGFELIDIPYGNYFLSINFIGYEKKIINNIELSASKKELNLESLLLKPAIEELADVEVQAARNYIDLKIDKKVVNVSQNTYSAGSTAARVLENVPGVQVDIDDNVTLRGTTSYTVLIDDRPSILSGPDMLKQLPANSIENIEIITNPSAKYDPDGTAGIINVIMKKDRLEGINGMVNITAGTKGKYGGDFNVNFKRKKSNFFVGADYNRFNNYFISTNLRENYLSDTVSFLTEQTDRMQAQIPWKFNTGVDLYLNDKTSLTLSGSIGGFGHERDFNTIYHEYDTITGKSNYSNSDNYFEIDGVYLSGTLSMHRNFQKEGHFFDASLTVWNWDSDNKQSTYEINTDGNGTISGLSRELRTLDQVYRETYHFKFDYTLPINNGKFEAGVQAILNPGDSEYLFENYDSELGVWVLNPDYTNTMEFRRDLYSAYSTFSNSWNNFQYQLGLRAEYTDRMLKQITMETEWPVEILNFYPTFHVSRDLKNEQQLQFGYSRRINRPQPWDLNPFPGYNDMYNSFVGNPLLKPEDTDALELNYIKRVKKGMLSATMFFRQSRNSQVMTIDDTQNHMMNITWENLGRSNVGGMEYMANLNLKKWLNINISGNLYYNEIEGKLAGNDFSQSIYGCDVRLNSTFILGKSTRLQAIAFYESPRADGQGIKEADFITMFGIRQDIWDRKASLSLNIRDPFNTHYYNVETVTDDFYSYFKMDGESPSVRITFSYRLNDYQRRREEADIQVGGGM